MIPFETAKSRRARLEPSLADQIVQIIKTEGWQLDRVLAERLGCSTAYVRVVWQRRLSNVARERERSRAWHRRNREEVLRKAAAVRGSEWGGRP
jgi:hypothetical protein